jgi:hypothetical protein
LSLGVVGRLEPLGCDFDHPAGHSLMTAAISGRAKKKWHAMRANAPEWEPGRRDTLEMLLSDFVPPFPASGRRNVGALPRNVSSCQTGFRDDAA